MTSIYLYPSLCFFEGTKVSVGRGTEMPFQIYGHPKLPVGDYRFVPTSYEGAKNPKLKGETCYGEELSKNGIDYMKTVRELHLKWILDAYDQYPEKESFFLENAFFNLLAGNNVLMEQIVTSTSLEQIKLSWEPRLTEFKKMRTKYILYEDFE